MKRISPFELCAHALLACAALACILPFALLAAGSLSSEREVLRHGYSFVPRGLTLEAYRYLVANAAELGRAYSVTIGVTVIGTVSSLVLTSLLAYPLSKTDFPLRGAITALLLITILFNGGLVPTYLVYTRILHIKNTLFALIVPGLLMNGFSVLLMRTFFQNTIPSAVLESARIDGAGEFRSFISIVLPLSLPILATVGLLQTLLYWNDWYNGLIYLTDPRFFGVQVVLNRIITDIQYLSSTGLGSIQSGAYSNVPGETVRMAIAVVGSLPILAAYPFFQKFVLKGITIGAVKG
jgi:putative aldouronate transport system permease protein